MPTNLSFLQKRLTGIVANGTPEDLETLWGTLSDDEQRILLNPGGETLPPAFHAMIRDCLAPSGPGRPMAAFLLDRMDAARAGACLFLAWPMLAGEVVKGDFSTAADLDRWKDAASRLWGWADVLSLPASPPLTEALLGNVVDQSLRVFDHLDTTEHALAISWFGDWLEKIIDRWQGRQEGDLDDALDAVLFHCSHPSAAPPSSRLSHVLQGLAFQLAGLGAGLLQETREELALVVERGAVEQDFVDRLLASLDVHHLEGVLPGTRAPATHPRRL
jgi:hypothetical protein